MLPDYRNRINKRPRLSNEAQVALMRQWRDTGDLRYRDQVIESNLGLALHLSIRQRGYAHVELSDLVQLANLALLHAANRFDVDRGVAFATFATWWIRSFHNHHLQSNYIVRLSTNHARRKILSKRSDLLAIGTSLDPYERQAMREKLATKCDAKVSEVELCETQSLQASGLDNVADETDPQQLVEAKREREDVLAAVHTLPVSIREMMSLRFENDLFYEEIGDNFACSRETIRKLVAKNCKTLREHPRIAPYK